MVKSTLPTLRELMRNGRYSLAVQIVKNSQKTFKEKLGKLKCLEGFDNNFKAARRELENLLSADFIDSIITYISPLFTYHTNTQNMSMMNSLSMIEESFLENVDSLKHTDTINSESADNNPRGDILPWTLFESQFNPVLERKISFLVIENLKIRDFSTRTYRVRLLDLANNFHLEFKHNMQEYLEYLSFKLDSS